MVANSVVLRDNQSWNNSWVSLKASTTDGSASWPSTKECVLKNGTLLGNATSFTRLRSESVYDGMHGSSFLLSFKNFVMEMYFVSLRCVNEVSIVASKVGVVDGEGGVAERATGESGDGMFYRFWRPITDLLRRVCFCEHPLFEKNKTGDLMMGREDFNPCFQIGLHVKRQDVDRRCDPLRRWFIKRVEHCACSWDDEIKNAD